MAWDTVKEKKDELKKGATSKTVALRPADHPGSSDITTRGDKDLQSGMELLELDFLLSVVENTLGNDSNDVEMRKLSFTELLRRNQLNEIDSNALKIYAVNDGNLFGKVIQCEAMKQLTKRTS